MVASRVASILACLALLSLSCRQDDPSVSGQPYVCDCHFVTPDGNAELLLNVCEIRAGDAIDNAEACAVSEGFGDPQYCDCHESSAQFCDIGSCDQRYQL